MNLYDLAPAKPDGQIYPAPERTLSPDAQLKDTLLALLASPNLASRRPLFEQYVVRALRLSEGDPLILFSSTLGNILWGFLVLSLILPPLRRRFQRRTAT